MASKPKNRQRKSSKLTVKKDSGRAQTVFYPTHQLGSQFLSLRRRMRHICGGSGPDLGCQWCKEAVEESEVVEENEEVEEDEAVVGAW